MSFARVHALLHRDGVADEIREEIVRMRAEDYERSGEPPPDAARHARQRVGNLALLQDHGYDARGGGFIETVVQDVRYALRQLARQLGFTVVALLALALGIGLSTALFSVIDAALLRPLPYPHPEQLVDVMVDGRSPAPGDTRPDLLAPSLDDIRLIRRSSRSFSDIAAWESAPPAIVTDPEPERLSGEDIDEGYLRLYGVTPIVGRGIESSDLVPGAPRVVLIGYDCWQRRYGGTRDVVGRTLHFDTGGATIVGVLPASFQRRTDFWRPLMIDSTFHGMRGWGMRVDGRLRPQIDRRQAENELDALLPRSANESSGQFVVLESLRAVATRDYPATVAILSGAVALILLIACLNVAGMLLAKGQTRIAEMAIRRSIGSGASRLMRQLLTESLVLSIVGGAAGIPLARLSLDTLVANLPMALPANSPATLNLRVLASSAMLSILVAIVFGLAPAVRLARAGGGSLGRAGGIGPASPRRRSSSVLIAAEVAVAIVLLAGAALMLRSFDRMLSVNLGFDPRSIATLEAETIDPRPAVLGDYYSSILDRVRNLPDVAAAGAIDEMPLGLHSRVAMAIGERTAGIALRRIFPGYFEAMGLPLKAGRFAADRDLRAAPPVAVIDKMAATRLFPDGSAVERTVTLHRVPTSFLVVGVVGSVRFWGPLVPGAPELFLVFRPDHPGVAPAPRAFTVVVRPSAHARALAPELRQIAETAEPRAVIGAVRTGDAWLEDALATPRERAVLLALLGAFGLLLTLVGIFGMTAYAVARRTQEIGVRVAIGATPADVLTMMLIDVAKPVAMGIAIGLAGAAFATRIIALSLFETTPTDPGTFSIVR